MSKSTKSLKRIFKYAILFIIIFGVLLTFTNLKHLKQHFFEINLCYFILTLSSAFVVYLIEGIFLLFSLRLYKEELPLLHAFRYSLIINSVGYFVSLGGITPFATQIHVLDHHNISVQKATASRVIQVIFFNFFFILLLLIGLISILTHYPKSIFSVPIIIITVSFFFLLISAFYLSIFWKPFQKVAARGLFNFLNSVVRVFTKKVRFDQKWAENLLNEFHNGFRIIIRTPHSLITLFLISLIDWVFWISVMYFSFFAMNYSIHPGALIIGFSIGQLVGILSMMPGGAGTMEGAMALVYTSLGIPLATAVGVIVLYRLAFYIIPFLVSIPFYFSLKHKSQDLN